MTKTHAIASVVQMLYDCCVTAKGAGSADAQLV